MNKRLDDAIAAARRALGEDAQEELAALVEYFVTGQTLDPEAALTDEQENLLEQRLDASRPEADPADYEGWLRAKIDRAIRDADADPDRRRSLAEMRSTFGLGS